MKKTASSSKNAFQYLFPPLAVAVILLITFASGGFYPFGEKSVAWSDMSQQSIPLLSVFRSALLGESSLFFSFSQAGGVGIFPALCFFVLSPFSLISIFFDTSELIFCANIMLLLKLSAAAFTAAIFFRRFWPGLMPLLSSALSIMYAMCGFALMYYQTLTWMDTLILFPVLIVAFSRLACEKRPLAFILLLASMMITGFYMSIMVVIFLLLFSPIYIFLFIEKKDRPRAAALFSLSGVTAALLASPVLIPSLLEYLDSARTAGAFSKVIRTHGTGNLFTKLPLLLCAAIVLPLFVWYLIEGRSSSGRKRRYLLFALSALMLAPFFAERVNLMWHLGSYQAYPCRFSYITSLIMLSVCAEALFVSETSDTAGTSTPKKASQIGYSLSCLLPMAAALLYCRFLLTKHLSELSKYSRSLWGDQNSLMWIVCSFAVFAVCYLIYFAFRRNRRISLTLFSCAVLLLAVAEASFNSIVYLGNIQGANGKWLNACAITGSIESPEPDDFFRTKTRSKLFDVNWLAAMGQNSLGHYTSLTGEDYLFSLKRLGYSGYWMEIGSHGSSDFIDGLLCTRYVIEDDGSVTEVTAPFGLGAVMSKKPSAELPTLPRPEIQNMIYDEVFSDGTLMTEYPFADPDDVSVSKNGASVTLSPDEKEGHISFSIDVSGRQYLYFDCFNLPSNRLTEAINGSLAVTVNDVPITDDYPSKKLNGMLLLGEFEDEHVEIALTLKKKITVRSFGVWGMDVASLEGNARQISSGVLTTGKASMHGSVTAEKDSWLLVQIPYDDGFTATVNGKRTEISRAYGTFMAIPLDGGENEISFSYFPRGMKTGLAMLALGLALTLLLASSIFRRLLASERLLTRLAVRCISVLCLICSAAVFLGVYAVCWFM